MEHLYVIPARDEPVAVILRRAARWYHLILWQTLQDVFTHGAWIKGRIYEDKCDLSPDGRLFVYFVLQGNRVFTSFTCAWTAVSRPPWLQALVLWPQGTTYYGGGKFTTPRTLWVGAHGETHPDFPLPPGSLQIIEQYPTSQANEPPVPEAYWSGFDHAGHVIYTQGHRLYRRRNDEDLLVADFTALTPDPQPAPDWATQPL